jgi:hypothetical protein
MRVGSPSHGTRLFTVSFAPSASNSRYAWRFAGFVAADDLVTLEQHLRNAEWDSRTACEVRLWPAKGTSMHIRLDTNVIPGHAGCIVVLTDVSERAGRLGQT